VLMGGFEVTTLHALFSYEARTRRARATKPK
jgi:hypothetical protein